MRAEAQGSRARRLGSVAVALSDALSELGEQHAKVSRAAMSVVGQREPSVADARAVRDRLEFLSHLVAHALWEADRELLFAERIRETRRAA